MINATKERKNSHSQEYLSSFGSPQISEINAFIENTSYRNDSSSTLFEELPSPSYILSTQNSKEKFEGFEKSGARVLWKLRDENVVLKKKLQELELIINKKEKDLQDTNSNLQNSFEKNKELELNFVEKIKEVKLNFVEKIKKLKLNFAEETKEFELNLAERAERDGFLFSSKWIWNTNNLLNSFLMIVIFSVFAKIFALIKKSTVKKTI